MKEEANAEMMEIIKIGSNKICIRNDLAKKNMMISPESCQAIMDMGNVELIRTEEIQSSMPIVSNTTCLREQLYVHVRNTSDPTKR